MNSRCVYNGFVCLCSKSNNGYAHHPPWRYGQAPPPDLRNFSTSERACAKYTIAAYTQSKGNLYQRRARLNRRWPPLRPGSTAVVARLALVVALVFTRNAKFDENIRTLISRRRIEAKASPVSYNE